jgi:hypothetical protein
MKAKRLSFIFPNLGFSKGYNRKNKKIPCPRNSRQGLRSKHVKQHAGSIPTLSYRERNE